MKEIIIYGAGNIGRYAKDRLGKGVCYFCDGNASLHGTSVEGIPVISIDRLEQLYDKYAHEVFIAIFNNEVANSVQAMLSERNIKSKIFDWQTEMATDDKTEVFSDIYKYGLWGGGKDSLFFSGGRLA